MLERKGLVNRLIAAIVDSVIAMVAAMPFALVPKVGMLLAAAVYCAFPLMEIMLGQTPGKMIWKMRVTTADGSVPSQDQRVRRALIRWSPLLASAALSVIGMFGILGTIIGFLGSLALLAGSIVLLVLSFKTIQTSKLAFWDVQAGTAVMGPQGVGIVAEPPLDQPAGFEPVMPTATTPESAVPTMQA